MLDFIYTPDAKLGLDAWRYRSERVYAHFFDGGGDQHL
jgi:hypothetical protein